MSFFKNLFSRKSKKYQQYSGGDIKIIAMKTRIILETQLEKLQKQVDMESKEMTGIDRTRLVTFVSRATECECLKIIVQLIRRVENSSERIANCKGNMAELKSQLAGIQSVLWLNKAGKIHSVDYFLEFCENYFQGKDIGKDFALTLETYRLFPIMKCLCPSEPVAFKTQIELMKPFLNNYFSPGLVSQFGAFLKDNVEKTTQSVLGFQRYPIKQLQSQSEPIQSHEEKKIEQPKPTRQPTLQPTLPLSGNISLIIPENSQIWAFEQCSPQKVIHPVRAKTPQKPKHPNQDLFESQVNLLPANHDAQKYHERILPTQPQIVSPNKEVKEASYLVEIEPAPILKDPSNIFQSKEPLPEVLTVEGDWRERDETESLEFIHQVLGKPKAIKKRPYMVSIYAREQYLQKIQSAK